MTTGLFSRVLTMSLNGSLVIGMVLLLRLLLRRGPRGMVCILWVAAVFRLLCPVAVEFPFDPERGISFAEMLVHDWQQTVVEDTVTLYSHTDAYAAGIAEGRQPLIHKASGAFYLLAGEDDRQKPDTAKDVLFPVLEKLWLTGVGFFALWNLIRWLLLRRRLSDAAPFGEYWVSDHTSAPFVLGLFRPRIYLPPGLEEPDRTMILTHERCHIRRGDPWLKLLLLVAVGIHWFNPVVWLGYRLAVRDMEIACDEASLQKLGAHHRWDYAQALLRQSVGRESYVRAMTGFGTGGVKQRIVLVLDRKKGSPLRSGACLALCLAMVPVMVVDAAPPWPVRWIGQLREEAVRIEVIPEHTEQTNPDYTLRQKQTEHLVGYLKLVEEDQISVFGQTPVIEEGTLELVAGENRYHLCIGYYRDNGRPCLRMTRCGGPEPTYLIENVPLITYVQHLFSHYHCISITAGEVTPDMIEIQHITLGSRDHLYVYQIYCAACDAYIKQYMVRDPRSLILWNKRK